LTELLVAVCVVGILVGLTFAMFASAHRFADRLEGQVAQVSPKHAKKRAPRRPATTPQWIPNQYVVRFNASVTNPQAEATRLAGAVPAQVLSVYRNVFKGASVRIQPGDLAALKADPAVARVEQAHYIHAMNIPTGVSRIQYIHAPKPPPFQLLLPTLISSGPANPVNGNGPRNLPTGAGTTTTIGNTAPIKAVAVIDTGIDSTHPELNVVFSMGFGNPDGEDQNSHGTHVSGTIGARGISVTGVFPGVPLWSLRVLDASGSGSNSDLIDALDFLATRASQVGVANLSLGGQFDQSVNDAIDACTAAGIVMCVAAGNSSEDSANLSPASAPTAICVSAFADSDGLAGGKGAACSTGDNDDTFAVSFSCFGDVVAVCAPGVDIQSTFPIAMGSYGMDTGTSMATPHTAGMAALALSLGSSPSSSAGGNASAPRNIPGATNNGSGSGPGFPLLTTPAAVKTFLIQNTVEAIPGPGSGGGKRTYPLITGR
jgi:subtilisin family serine protease